jgi:glycosyltransferase involved in cell wall biosynthesis
MENINNAMQENEPIQEVQYPLVSCIMPTTGRPDQVFMAIQYFMAQDYPDKELVIVYNKVSDIPVHESGAPYLFPDNIKFVQANTRIIGNKRNVACSHAQGAIIAQWDDDDIYNTNRLTLQVQPILAGEADITGLQNFVFYEAPTTDSWMADERLFSEIYVGNVHGGSLVYNRRVWEHVANYPNISMGEDAGFLRCAINKGARLKGVDGYNSFVYVRHNQNTWQFEPNNFRRYPGWLQAQLPQFAQQYAPYYSRLATTKVNTQTTTSNIINHQN